MEQHSSKNHIAREKHLQELYDFAPFAYLSVTKDGKINECNKQTSVITGYSYSELLDSSILNLYADTDGGEPFTKQILKPLKFGREVKDEELQMQRKDGSIFWAKVTMHPEFDNKGNVTESRTIISDINKSKLHELQQIESQKMQSLNTMAGGIAHNFNNLLSIIIGNATLFNAKYMQNNPQGREYIEQILKASHRSADLVKQIMAFGATATSNRSFISLSTLINDAMPSISQSLKKGIRLNYNLLSTTNNIFADKAQVVELLGHLITNADDALPNGGEISISVKKIECDICDVRCHLKGHKPCVQLIVTDNGRGIEADNLTNIFEPFYSTKDISEGAGLGLSVVYTIVKNHHAVIDVQSSVKSPTSGTTILIGFPIPEEIYQKTSSEFITEDNITREKTHEIKHILLVDDEIKITKIYQEYLEKQNYKVTQCNNGYDAIALVEETPDRFDLIVTDQEMPKMSGVQFCLAVKRLRSNIPVILNTGYSKDFISVSAGNTGLCFDKFLLKPTSLKLLSKTIEECLEVK